VDVFDSLIRAQGDLAGVFEYDEADGPQNATAYFYHVESRAGAKYGGQYGKDFNASIPWS
jgi:hypothetical protein